MKQWLALLVLSVALLTAGCKSAETPATSSAATEACPETVESTAVETTVSEADDEWNGYMESVKARADAIRTALQQEPLTQSELNAKAQELYTLWDTALNDLWAEIKGTLPEEAYAQLLEQQRAWVTEKEQAAEAAGKEAEGGSMQTLLFYSAAAELTEERVYALYEILTTK